MKNESSKLLKDQILLIAKEFNDDEIKSVLKFDALSEAEKITGKSYKEDKETESLGFMMHIESSKIKNDMLSYMDDTCFSETESEYLRKVTEFGFELIKKISFKAKDWYDEKVNEHFYIMFHDEYSILLTWDTFRGDRNGGNFYYNWIPNKDDTGHYTSSGGYIFHKLNGDRNNSFGCLFNSDLTPHIICPVMAASEPQYKDYDNYDEYSKINKKWYEFVYKPYIESRNLVTIYSGHHDCREALKFNINNLAQHGKFAKDWIEQPFLWLLHYGDKSDSDNYKKINKKRINMLPDDIKNIIKTKI